MKVAAFMESHGLPDSHYQITSLFKISPFTITILLKD